MDCELSTKIQVRKTKYDNSFLGAKYENYFASACCLDVSGEILAFQVLFANSESTKIFSEYENYVSLLEFNLIWKKFISEKIFRLAG